MRNVLNVFLAVAVSSSTGVCPSRAEDAKPPQVPQTSAANIQFFATGPQVPGVQYAVKLVVELEGSDTKFEDAANFTVGASGGLQAFYFGAVLEDEVGWKYEVKDGKLAIEGWRDPKTGRVHRVKKIDVETDLPKERKPKVDVPKKT